MSRSTRLVLLFAAIAAALWSIAPAAAASSNLFSGRAYALGGQVEGIQVGPLADTGNIDASGGALHACVIEYPSSQPCLLQVPSALDPALAGKVSTDFLATNVVAGGDKSSADATVDSFSVNAAGLTISGTAVYAQAVVQCSNGVPSVSAYTNLASLSVAGLPTGPINVGPLDTYQKIDLPGYGSIVLNGPMDTSGSVGNYGQATVKAIEIIVKDPVTQKTTDLVVAYAHADVLCANPPPPQCSNAKDFVTGGGTIAPKANFAVGGGIKNGAFWGHLVYNDHAGLKVKGTDVTAYVVTGATSRHIEGKAEINGVPGTYMVDVSDNGEPGRGVDWFKLTLSTGYTNGGFLSGGNIQLHHPC
jgi:hypothetical protein